MASEDIDIRWENSAQGKEARPNPFVEKSISYLKQTAFEGRDVRKLRVADQGCGNLRHLAVLQRSFKTLFLVDTVLQINRTHRIGSKQVTLAQYIAGLNGRRNSYCLLDNRNFRRAALNLDVVFCVCVLDVIPARVRREIVLAAAANLKDGGYYCLIVPRNDQTITSRCTAANAYEDGHVFKRGQFGTFYANFSNGSRPFCSLSRLLREAGFGTVVDLSVYRHLCLVLLKQVQHRG
jgi:SAM-dependent methyltransferase